MSFRAMKTVKRANYFDRFLHMIAASPLSQFNAFISFVIVKKKQVVEF